MEIQISTVNGLYLCGIAVGIVHTGIVTLIQPLQEKGN